MKNILLNTDTLLINDISIKPIRVCEGSVSTEDNSAFLFTYKGMKILHLGDAQAQIKAINDPVVQAHMLEIIPQDLDLLFMPIDWKGPILNEAVDFVNLFKPRRVIPMHYWTQACKQGFFTQLNNLNNQGEHYVTQTIGGPEYSFSAGDEVEPVVLINLTREAYSGEIVLK